VVDADGIYFGEGRTEPKFALAVLEALLAKEGVRNVYVCATDRARHGDFVSLWGSIDRRRYFVAPLKSSEHLRGSFRMPLVGTFRRHFEGGWSDVEDENVWFP
jgi:hypothetical protein